MCVCIHNYLLLCLSFIDEDEINFTKFKDVSLAFSALFSKLQKEVKNCDFEIIKTACMLRASKNLREAMKETQDINSLFKLFAENTYNIATG